MADDSGKKYHETSGHNNRLIVFEDLLRCDETSIQLILREVESLDLTKALKGASTALQEKICAVMSNRAAWLIKKDMEHLGALPLTEVEQAQSIVIGIASKLEEAGKITIPRPGG